MSGNYLFRLVLAILLAATAGCGFSRRGGRPPPTVLVFTNESLAQADVFMVMQGMGARRIGTVMSGRTDTLFVPPDLASRGGSVNIIARLLAHRAVPQTGPVSIVPGEIYEVRLSSDTRLISFLPGRQ
jgi:hypothetical protein